MSTQRLLTGRKIEIARNVDKFPASLKHVHPEVKRLYVIGDIGVLKEPAIAIVGARKATPYGLDCARHFAQIAAQMGIIVVSGGAVGCDQAAHEGALEANGKTIVVLGSGADVIYPSRAGALFNNVIAEGGAVISEAPWGSAPLRYAFVKRNRIIAGLAQATLIVEAGLPSGTFSTADATLALGKEVLVIPGSIRSRESEGSNKLLLQGALPVTSDESFRDYLMMLFGKTDALTNSLIGNQGGICADDDGAFDVGAFDAGVSDGKAFDTGASVSDKDKSAGSSLRRALLASPLSAEEVAILLKCDLLKAVRELSDLEFYGVVSRQRDGRYTLRKHFSAH